ncbi:lactose-specific PTS transporter subunit EIIC [Geobacillus stearothermophilus]|uniref:lactose-specific PTS transporter subunit EIIC n=1 Tax=Geobacillus stearothermophilus TaxID=1422 RepID=UPI002E1E952E|nr:lactose-specific PTS transporter subunit EIIC [Geobacillus stearothermophilus]MED3722755.1 lactose-specific PTS transporter subunit EIIC [Geobacillus stearothermophilus]MED3749297.1 lactose-specific PTS transporter subunit EIIC [Geobacillus stearothermophilus]MED3753946.1 lactose-specific PTS transporter subunit EIIC [Geobacillus stearothermophilus]MED3769519.1 lactose-specific PTS transporter subunit EIIC [Geobacillus stearothermophilus]MED3772763.1 lactose-specific PTS transporter subunit
MNGLVAQIEKMKPFFEKISRNVYLRAVKDGFIASMPVVLFSSIFMLVAFVPNVFGFYWPEHIEAILLKAYNYSMGILAVLVTATTAKYLTDSFNRDLPSNNQINNISTMLASIVGFLLVSADAIEGGFSSGYMGSAGLLTAFISAFVVGNIYKVCVKNDVTIKLPEQVPPNIAQTFKDLIPFALSTLFFWLFDLVFRNLTGMNFAEGVIKFFQPLFSAADGYLGLALIYGAMAFFWFIGIHGPSIVEPAVTAIYYVNIEANLKLFQAGEHASHVLAPGLQHFVATLGGTGATLIITLMFAFLAKSEQNRAIGKAATIPVLFGVNEPILFGAPLVLNPVFFVPFILAPIANVWLFKFFVDVLNMNGFIYVLPWTTPGPLGLVMGTGFAGLSFVLAILLLVVDFLIYYPFFKAYDNEIYQKELETAESDEEEVAAEVDTALDEVVAAQMKDVKNVLVLCAGGGTSGLLANALKKAAAEYNVPIIAGAGAYGSHNDILKDFDLVILAPQVASNYEVIKKDTDRLGIKLVSTSGQEYIELTNNPKKAIDFVLKQFNN